MRRVLSSPLLKLLLLACLSVQAATARASMQYVMQAPAVAADVAADLGRRAVGAPAMRVLVICSGGGVRRIEIPVAGEDPAPGAPIAPAAGDPHGCHDCCLPLVTLSAAADPPARVLRFVRAPRPSPNTPTGARTIRVKRARAPPPSRV